MTCPTRLVSFQLCHDPSTKWRVVREYLASVICKDHKARGAAKPADRDTTSVINIHKGQVDDLPYEILSFSLFSFLRLIQPAL